MNTFAVIREFHAKFGFLIRKKPVTDRLVAADDIRNSGLDDVRRELRRCVKRLKLMDAAYGDTPGHFLKRCRLIIEEVEEFMQAMQEQTPERMLHELSDLRYTVDGTALSLGFNDDMMDAALLRIHAANMSKAGFDKELGKTAKGEDFVPATMHGLFDAHDHTGFMCWIADEFVRMSGGEMSFGDACLKASEALRGYLEAESVEYGSDDRVWNMVLAAHIAKTDVSAWDE